MIRVSATSTRNNGAKIARRIHEKKLRLLNQFGTDVRVESQLIQQESGRTSAPGSPPSVHSPAPNLETIEHVVDSRGESVIVGPVYVPGSTVTPALPGLLEHGGRGVIRSRRRTKRGLPRKPRTVVFRARPFIRPAAIKALESLKKNAGRGI